jgi:hypothetical protein
MSDINKTHIVLLFDISGSMLPKWQSFIDSIKTLLKSLINTYCTLAVFNDTMKVFLEKKTEEINDILKDIVPSGTTSLRDSLIELVNILENKNMNYFILVTDGDDTSSKKTQAEYQIAIDTIKEKKIEFILIGDNINTKDRARQDGISNILDIDLRYDTTPIFRQLSRCISDSESFERNYSIAHDCLTQLNASDNPLKLTKQ